ncbi:hypothetical protein GCM10023204_34650 [Actinomycetospora succinea]
MREVVPAKELNDRGLTLARELASRPAAANAEIKVAVALGTVSSLPSALEHEGARHSHGSRGPASARSPTP